MSEAPDTSAALSRSGTFHSPSILTPTKVSVFNVNIHLGIVPIGPFACQAKQAALLLLGRRIVFQKKLQSLVRLPRRRT